MAVLHYDESLPTGAEDNARVPSGDGTNRRGTTVKLDSDRDGGEKADHLIPRRIEDDRTAMILTTGRDPHDHPEKKDWEK